MVVYEIDNIKKLIDLNGDLVNFELTFRVSSENSAEYDAVVVDQTTLDTGNLVYKKVKGVLAGKVIADKNIYQNYFLILRSDKPIKVNVEINIKEIEPSKEELEFLEEQVKNEEEPLPVKIENTNSMSNTKIILLLAATVIIGYFVYKYFISGKTTSSTVSENLTYPVPNSDLLAKLNSLDFDL
jgi:hypothetical protein